MTLVKVNNRPAVRTWNGLVNELFTDLEKSIMPQGNISLNRNLPPVNIIENADGYHAELLAAGRNKELFKVEVENNQLIISYEEEKKETPADWKQVRHEFNLGNFKRAFNLDEKMDAENIKAKYEDGLLKVFIPKKPEVKPAAKTIEIQ